MKSTLIKIASGLGIGMLLPLKIVSAALASPGVTAPTSPIGTISEAQRVVCGAIDWIFYIAIVYSIIQVLMAAFGYMKSPDKPASIHSKLTWAAVGLAVAIIAKGFPYVVGSVLGVTSIQGVCQ